MIKLSLSSEAIGQFREILISIDFSELDDSTHDDIRQIETQLREELSLGTISDCDSEIILTEQECNSAKITLEMHGIYVDKITDLESQLPLYESEVM